MTALIKDIQYRDTPLQREYHLGMRLQQQKHPRGGKHQNNDNFKTAVLIGKQYGLSSATIERFAAKARLINQLGLSEAVNSGIIVKVELSALKELAKKINKNPNKKDSIIIEAISRSSENNGIMKSVRESKKLTKPKATTLNQDQSGELIKNSIAHHPNLKQYCKYELITPEKAREIIDRQGKNRAKTPIRTIEYAELMKNGMWEPNGETISFDTKGRLMNGQHRMHAIVASGLPQILLCVYGVEESALETFDRGKNRTAKDAFTAEKIPYPNFTSGPLIYLAKYKDNLPFPTGKCFPDYRSWLRKRRLNVLDVYYEYPNITDSIASMMQYRTRRWAKPLGLTTCFHYLFNEKSPQDCQRFFEVFTSSNQSFGGEKNNAASALYKAFDELSIYTNLQMNFAKLAFFWFRAWNDFRANKRVSKYTIPEEWKSNNTKLLINMPELI